MKSNPISFVGAILILLFCNYSTQAQSFGTKASAVWITDCNQSNFFNTSGNVADLIGPAPNVFNNANLGVHTQNSSSLILSGGQVNTFKNPASSNVCVAQMYYRVYLQSGVGGAFTTIALPFLENCNVPGGSFPSGQPCIDGDQKYQGISSSVNLTAFAPGNYVVEVYYDVTGSNSSTSLCNELVTLNNGGANYKAFFTIQSPNLSSTNPSSCFGNEGSITIGGLAANSTYDLTYTDDGVTVGPASFTTNGSGQLIITPLNKGFYSNFVLVINGCTTPLFTGIILSDPIFVPTFPSIPPFCSGTTAPLLPATSTNGMTGTWSPATISNTASGAYTFTPAPNQCGFPITINVTVTPRTVPTFPFGTSLIICGSGTVPVLPNTSTNGVNGTWSPSVVDNQNSGVYTFTQSGVQCATGTTFTVTVNPNITPTFSFGTSTTFCSGTTAPTLPTTSDNSITGTWSPATVSNTTSGTYTFTPTAGQCATPASFTVTVDPIVPPTFSFGSGLTICNGGIVPTLPTTADNGITGTWSPATVSNTASGTYTFTPTGGQCTTPATFTVTVNPNVPPTFAFGGSIVICPGGTVPTLPTTSSNGITGTWSPSVIDNMNTGTYTFTPTAGLCATVSTLTVTVTPNVTPTFTFGTSATICSGTAVPTLPTTSDNGVTGTWSPATVSNTASGSYTFTPTAGVCAVPVSFTMTVDPIVPPTFSFGSTLTICANDVVPALPTTADNGITGTWSPATVSNTASGTYTFTPTAGQCTTPATFTVTVNPNVPPTFAFGGSLVICSGETVPTLPTTSDNGITGTWSPSVIDNLNTATYTFTPTAGLCATIFTLTVTVNPNVTPTFSFGTSATYCSGTTVPTLPTTSSNNITGTWSPATVSNTVSGTYNFTPTAGQCALPTSFTVTVDPNIAPTFSFGASTTICAGAAVPTLPTTSDNGITGTWSPATVSNTVTDTYTFTPTAGLCALPTTFTVTVDPNITPTFNFGTSLAICEGGTVPTLPTTSDNGITGTWSPTVVDNTTSGVYTFTPTTGLCAVQATFTVTVNPNVTPSFTFGTSATICSGSTAPILPTTSDNSITGTWSPATVSNTADGVYTFTPTAGQCVIPPTVTFTVTVTANIIPTFDFGTTLSICTGGTVPTLPTTSTNGIAGTWAPAIVSTQASGTYVFTPTPVSGQCFTTASFVVTVSPILTPAFGFGTFQSVCINTTPTVLLSTSTNGIAGTWSPSVVTTNASGSTIYTFTPSAGQCATGTTFTLEVNPIPSVTVRADTSVYDGAVVPLGNSTLTTGATITWTNSNTAIGLAASGSGNVPSFTATNLGTQSITATITVTPRINGCVGAVKTYIITVLPLNKDVFVPNVFSPNRDGKNDILFVYGNYITKVDMHIYNQWGQEIAKITNKTQGWDGTHKGNPQPVGVYVYVLKAELANGKTVNLKGSITLVR